MKKLLKKISFLRIGFLTLIVSLLFSYNGIAQELDLSAYSMKFRVRTAKNPDQSRLLEVNFFGQNKKDRKDKIPVYEAEISFFNTSDDEETLLGTTLTNSEGIAQLILAPTQEYDLDEDGYIEVEARYKGSENLKKQKKSLSFKDLFLKLNLEEVDSVKTVLVNAYVLDSVRTEIPVDDVDVIVSVGGLISRMPVEEGSTEEGAFEFEFPNDIPGDKDGVFEIYAFVEDHDDFGDVLISEQSDWGIFDDIEKPKKNELWTEAAPIWMYVVLTILLVGVWTNYLYTLIKLKGISKAGNQTEVV